MNNETISRIVTQYGYRDFTLLPLEKGYRNESHPFTLPDGSTLNLILYKNEPGSLELIGNADRTADFAAKQGLPARQTIDKPTLKLQAGLWRKYGRIYTYLPGRTIPWEAYSQAHIKLLGKTLGDLHDVLQAIPTNDYPLVSDQYEKLTEAMRQYFSRPGVQDALEDKLELKLEVQALDRFTRVLRASARLENQQVLHMDFVRSNILFTGRPAPKVSGILDFEKTAVGHPTFDIARTLAFLLVDCKYKTEIQARKYFLRSGYEQRGKRSYHPVNLKDGNKSYPLLEVLVELFLLYDFYKFLRHNPYESLPDNEHFRRTSAILQNRSLIQTS